MYKERVGLYFGSFNPIHIGHLIIANHILNHSNLTKVWFIITPMSPFKKKKTLLHNEDRLELVELALEPYKDLEACTVEFTMPQPNYTTHTLAKLNEQYPSCSFSVIMGQDNLDNLHRWKNYKTILDHYQIYSYPRVQKNTQRAEELIENHQNVHKVQAPIIEISATHIRKNISLKKDVRPLLPPKVWECIDRNLWYF